MSVEFWQSFLGEWNDERKRILSLIPAGTLRPEFLSELSSRAESEPARPLDIDAIEARVGSALPEDLRSFYEVSDGWRLFGMSDLAIAAIDRIDALPKEPRGYILDINDYFDNKHIEFVPAPTRSRALLLTTVSRCGFCVAVPGNGALWDYAWAEFGFPSQRFDNFTSVMGSMRWFCLHYLSSYLDH
jgi:hypothetical protein